MKEQMIDEWSKPLILPSRGAAGALVTTTLFRSFAFHSTLSLMRVVRSSICTVIASGDKSAEKSNSSNTLGENKEDFILLTTRNLPTRLGSAEPS